MNIYFTQILICLLGAQLAKSRKIEALWIIAAGIVFVTMGISRV